MRGKGLPAALVMGSAISLLKMTLLQGAPPSQAPRRINNALRATTAETWS